MGPKPDLLAIGHFTLDRGPWGLCPGGAVTYSALTALRMGYRPAVLTAGPPSQLPPCLGPPVATRCLPSGRTTAFHLEYRGGRRGLRLLSRARPIGPQDVPQEWRGTPVVLLAPVAGEVDPAIATLFPGALVGLAVQGWLRRWDREGRVYAVPWEGPETVLASASAVFVSREDLADADLPRRWAERAPLVVMTMGAQGALVYWRGRPFAVPALRVREADPTGAGDVFATAFLLRLRETGDPEAAARFACATASLSVRGPGVRGIPTRLEVEEALAGA